MNIRVLQISRVRALLVRQIEVKYQRRQEFQQFATKEGTYANDSSFASINDNVVYYEIVGGKNEKGNIYGLGKLTNKFIYSAHILTNLIEILMIQQIKKMRKTIHKLNNELILKSLIINLTPPNNNDDHDGNAYDDYLQDCY
ncbi:hypothetical protein CR513_38335, partial [Mucuna pruriens]